jgi:A/G-specific adenine glycosylase
MLNLDYMSLKQWFLENRRDLPWRTQPTPYAVWISEVMLQQTQVAVVIPYFFRWMERFPTIEDLAQAPLDEVIKMWEGLGYYSRARHLHAGAQSIVQFYQGKMPQKEEDLKTIKGLGPYTIGAILSFAFHQKKAAVDGNVLRVLTRYFNIAEDIAKHATVKKLRLIAESILPNEEPWIICEALIELGATVCRPKASCSKCPLKTTCQGYNKGTVDQLPVKMKRTQTTYLYRAVAVIRCGNSYLVKRGEKGQIMSDLYEFPFFNVEKKGIDERDFKNQIEQTYKCSVSIRLTLPPFSQSFTRYQVTLNPTLFHCQVPFVAPGLQWLSLSDLKQLAFSSGHRRILQFIQELPMMNN